MDGQPEAASSRDVSGQKATDGRVGALLSGFLSLGLGMPVGALFQGGSGPVSLTAYGLGVAATLAAVAATAAAPAMIRSFASLWRHRQALVDAAPAGPTRPREAKR